MRVTSFGNSIVPPPFFVQVDQGFVDQGRRRVNLASQVVGDPGTAGGGQRPAVDDAALRAVPTGAVRVVWPKGRPQMKEDHIRAVAPAADLVDVKVCAFSETLAALKLMIPRAKR